ncbi:hypothetical protein SLEP1_g44292 [Rubroshorea leprosula]|uniref:Uncharacterized protein n=1 Tax=Rubroshorea leprosula TaxID=152421 RepID=A0AAV5LFR1_9ROSI|nr:hypothetical protein SLEP1_g44292 [Rubroshorea leprosula]
MLISHPNTQWIAGASFDKAVKLWSGKIWCCILWSYWACLSNQTLGFF